ncbi:MAG: hypothetical protein ACOVQC_03665 [Flavobacterium sp.]|uniref:hypothetical protein n=1 Tax=Flavobacterium sp. TaxID=239 RepID=UPI00262C6863|nr:hypothetical protein [Flavobacterium sp.]
MKIKFFTLISTLFILCSYGQVVKCKTTGLAFRSKDETTDLWSKWSEFEAVELLLIIDADNNRIKIFSKEEQVYDIIKTYESIIDDDGDKTSKWLCINEDGLKCFVRLVKLNSQEGRNQIYVDFEDLMFVYNIYRLD